MVYNCWRMGAGFLVWRQTDWGLSIWKWRHTVSSCFNNNLEINTDLEKQRRWKIKDISFMTELVKKKGAFSRIKDTMFPQNNFLLLADYNICWTDAEKKARLWNEGEFSSLFRVFFFIKDFFQAVEIRQDCCQLLFLLLFCFLSSLFSLFFFFLPAFPDTLKIQEFGRCQERKAEEKKKGSSFSGMDCC